MNNLYAIFDTSSFCVESASFYTVDGIDRWTHSFYAESGINSFYAESVGAYNFYVESVKFT